MTMFEGGQAVESSTEKPTNELVSRFRYPVGDSARFEDTASKYLTNLSIDDNAAVTRAVSTTTDASNTTHVTSSRFLTELEVLTAAEDPDALKLSQDV